MERHHDTDRTDFRQGQLQPARHTIGLPSLQAPVQIAHRAGLQQLRIGLRADLRIPPALGWPVQQTGLRPLTAAGEVHSGGLGRVRPCSQSPGMVAPLAGMQGQGLQRQAAEQQHR